MFVCVCRRSAGSPGRDGDLTRPFVLSFFPMHKADNILETLRLKRSQLAAAGIRHAAVFGSTARNTAGPDSDVDVLVELTTNEHRSLLTVARAIQAVEAALADETVDVAVEDLLRPEIKPHILQEARFAF